MAFSRSINSNSNFDSQKVPISFANSNKKRKLCEEENVHCEYCDQKKLHPKVETMLKYIVNQSYGDYQRSRQNKVTASKISSVLCENAFKSDSQMLDEFVNGSSFQGNQCTRWGETHEPAALDKFCEVTNHDLIPHIDGKTLVMHPKYAYLAASPDGVTYCGKLVEIKCPWSKPVGTRARTVPAQYKAQLHLQQHVCDLDETFFVTYSPENHKCGKIKHEGRPETVNILKFMRDPKWLHNNLPKIKLFLMNVEHKRRQKTKTLSEIYDDLFD